ncbi:2,3-butanediol dehydrogenase [Halomonas pacifica]|nr:2,3-butanediol dehydrogenase [Halomonas pacifica]MDC8804447.1 2,3-butanediol dehydrogenase [Halomonas pacifica]
MNTMQAAVWHGQRDVRLERVAVPKAPSPGWVQVRVSWCGICGSDLHEYLAGPVFIPTGTPHPLTGIEGQCILGHEFCGEIVAVGANVEGLSPGQRVVADACQHCGECDYCTSGQYNLCEHLAFTGLMNDGAFAEFVNVPANLIYPLPDRFPLEAGALVEPLAVGMHAVHQARGIEGQTVVVLGAGTIGLCTILCAKAAGAARVLVLEMSAARKAKALEVGADRIIDPQECDPIEAIRAETGGYGAQVAFECIGHKHTAKLAIDSVRKAGRVVMVGIFEEPSEFNFFDIVATEKEVVGSLAYQGEFGEVIRLISDGVIDVQPLITGRIGLDEIIDRGFEELANHKDRNVKIIVRPGQTGRQAGEQQ